MSRELETTRAELAAVQLNLDKAHSDRSKVGKQAALHMHHVAHSWLCQIKSQAHAFLCPVIAIPVSHPHCSLSLSDLMIVAFTAL